MIGWLGAAAQAAVGGLKCQSNVWVRQVPYIGALAAVAVFVSWKFAKNVNADEIGSREEKKHPDVLEVHEVDEKVECSSQIELPPSEECEERGLPTEETLKSTDILDAGVCDMDSQTRDSEMLELSNGTHGVHHPETVLADSQHEAGDDVTEQVDGTLGQLVGNIEQGGSDLQAGDDLQEVTVVTSPASCVGSVTPKFGRVMIDTSDLCLGSEDVDKFTSFQASTPKSDQLAADEMPKSDLLVVHETPRSDPVEVDDVPQSNKSIQVSEAVEDHSESEEALEGDVQVKDVVTVNESDANESTVTNDMSTGVGDPNQTDLQIILPVAREDDSLRALNGAAENVEAAVQPGMAKDHNDKAEKNVSLYCTPASELDAIDSQYWLPNLEAKTDDSDVYGLLTDDQAFQSEGQNEEPSDELHDVETLGSFTPLPRECKVEFSGTPEGLNDGLPDVQTATLISAESMMESSGTPKDLNDELHAVETVSSFAPLPMGREMEYPGTTQDPGDELPDVETVTPISAESMIESSETPETPSGELTDRLPASIPIPRECSGSPEELNDELRDFGTVSPLLTESLMESSTTSENLNDELRDFAAVRSFAPQATESMTESLEVPNGLNDELRDFETVSPLQKDGKMESSGTPEELNDGSRDIQTVPSFTSVPTESIVEAPGAPEELNDELRDVETVPSFTLGPTESMMESPGAPEELNVNLPDIRTVSSVTPISTESMMESYGTPEGLNDGHRDVQTVQSFIPSPTGRTMESFGAPDLNVNASPYTSPQGPSNEESVESQGPLDEESAESPISVKRVIVDVVENGDLTNKSGQGKNAERLLEYDEYLADPHLSPTLRSQVLKAKANLERFVDESDDANQ